MHKKYECLKSKSTFYTQDMVSNARNNAVKFDWAKKMKDDTLQRADAYLEQGVQALWSLITSQSIPRSIDVCNLGCPVCGTKIFKEFGNFSWKSDVFESPWKISCPSCNSIFPSNDFEAYYKSGLGKNGFFEPDKADPTLLKNQLYPDKPEDWCVDDGYGWVDENNRHWKFIAYYNHMALWSLDRNTEGNIIKALNAFSDAYIYTGLEKYAQAGLIMLDRIADVYPFMDLSVYKDSDGYFNSHGHTGQGKIAGSISETFVIKPILTAYDALFPALTKVNIIPFLKEKSKHYSMDNPKDAIDTIQYNIEKGIVEEVFTAVKNAKIRGNTGMHQSSLALAALIIDNEELAKEWMEWVFQPGGMKRLADGSTILTGGNMDVALINDVDRDGFGDESAPSYNYLWLREFLTLAKVTQHFTNNPEWNLFHHPKFKKMFHAFIPFIFSSKYTPQIGDTGVAGKPEITIRSEEMLLGYKIYRSDILAQAVYFLNGNSTTGIRDDIFSEDPQEIAQKIQNVIDTKGPLTLGSFLLSGFGFAALRNGKGNDERSAWIYFGRNFGHGHRDTLNLGIYAQGVDMAPDLGNPEYKRYDWAKRYEWTLNTISHNTVVVDEAKQDNSITGNPLQFEANEHFQLLDVEAPDAYRQTSMYRRTVSTVRIDPSSSYIIDLFRVKGGSDHVYSFHGPEGEVNASGLTLVKQAKGTYAGECIPFGYAYDKDENQKREYTGSGYHYLYDVERDNNPAKEFHLDWDVKDTWNVLPSDANMHLSFTMLTDLDDVAMASGDPARNQPGNADHFRYMLAHRKGENLCSSFVSVIEPYQGQKKIGSVKRLNVLPLSGDDNNDVEMNVIALKVTLNDGRVDYIIHSTDSSTTYLIDNRFTYCGHFAFYSEKNGKLLYANLSDGALFYESNVKLFDQMTSAITGVVKGFTKNLRDENQIMIETKKPLRECLKGRTIFVKTGKDKQTAYPIEESRNIDDATIVLDIGDITLIHQWQDINDLSKGYRYAISEGNEIRIPLTYSVERV